MKGFVALSIAFCILRIVDCLSRYSSPVTNFYEDARYEDFNENELELLKPFIHVLQTHFDQISVKLEKSEKGTKPANEIDNQLKNLLLSFEPRLTESDDIFDTTFEYDISLPTIGVLGRTFSKNLSSDEAEDIENILQESVDEAHQIIQKLITKSKETEKQLISINKVKIIKFIYKMVSKVYGLGIKAGRTAYCTYSSIPALNATLIEGKANMGSCYNYTKTSVSTLRNDVQSAISDIRGNVLELVNIYKKIATRKSLLGKLYTVLLNVSKITKDIKGSRSAAIGTMHEVKNDGPIIVAKTKECATYSVPRFVVQLNETVTWLATCLAFEDDSTQGPEPEPESDEYSFERN